MISIADAYERRMHVRGHFQAARYQVAQPEKVHSIQPAEANGRPDDQRDEGKFGLHCQIVEG